MKKMLITEFALFTMLLANGCNVKTNQDDGVSHTLLTKTQPEVHSILGEPTGTLSGFWGDIYALVNGSTIIFYYDESGKVEAIKIEDINETETIYIK